MIGLFLFKSNIEGQYNDLFFSGKRPNIDYLNIDFSEEKVNQLELLCV